MNFFSYHLKGGCIGYHFIVDTRHGLDVIGDGLTGVDEAFKFFDYSIAIMYMNGNFSDTVGGSITSGSFNINDGINKWKS